MVMGKYKDPKDKIDEKKMLTCRVPGKLLERLDSLATKYRVVRTDLLISIIEDYIQWEERKKKG